MGFFTLLIHPPSPHQGLSWLAGQCKENDNYREVFLSLMQILFCLKLDVFIYAGYLMQ